MCSLFNRANVYVISFEMMCVRYYTKLLHITAILRHLVLVYFVSTHFVALPLSSSSSSSFFQLLTVRIANDNGKHKKTIKKRGAIFSRAFSLFISTVLRWLWKSLLFGVSLSIQRSLCAFFTYSSSSVAALYLHCVMLCNVCLCVGLESDENLVGCELGLTAIQSRIEMTILMTKKKTMRQRMPIEYEVTIES